MKTYLKIFFITILLIILSIPHIYATNSVINVIANTETGENRDIIIGDSSLNYEAYEDSTTLNPAPTVTHTSSSSSNNELSISDIISIILIAVCIVLMFLAIAILIRCK